MILKSFLISVSFAFLVSPVISSADPITPKEAAAWIAHVRNLLNVGEDFDLKEDAQRRVDAARAQFQTLFSHTSPRALQSFRDLGDGLHTLGHMAEHEHRFEKAIEFHRAAFEAYSKSGGLPTRESWNDGRQHAVEHVFMNLYDLGRYHERLGSKNLADRFFDAAFGFAMKYELQHLNSDRMESRFPALLDRIGRIRLESGRDAIEIGRNLNPVLSELKCASIFVAVD